MWLSMAEVFASELVVLDSLCSQGRATYFASWGLKLDSSPAKADTLVWSDELHPKHHQRFTRPSLTMVGTSAAGSLYTVGT